MTITQGGCEHCEAFVGVSILGRLPFELFQTVEQLFRWRCYLSATKDFIL